MFPWMPGPKGMSVLLRSSPVCRSKRGDKGRPFLAVYPCVPWFDLQVVCANQDPLGVGIEAAAEHVREAQQVCEPGGLHSGGGRLRMCHVPSSLSNGCAEQKQVTRFSCGASTA